MRNYLYIWHDVERQCVIASGIEFKDFLPCLVAQGGLLLIEHQSDVAHNDPCSGLGSVTAPEIGSLARENIYSWGNFAWADYCSPAVPDLSDFELAELLSFAHKARPLKAVALPSLGNRFLAYAHDDGWYLKLHYSNWSAIEELVSKSIPASLGPLSTEQLKAGCHGFWVSGGLVLLEEKTEDIDAVLNRHS